MYVQDLGTFEGTTLQLRQLVLDQIITYPDSHDQSDWGSKGDCGSTACASGWAQLFCDGTVQSRVVSPQAPFNRGRELLGLSWYDATRLFLTTNNGQAKLALKYLANGEEIDWNIVGHKYRQGESFEGMLRHQRDYVPVEDRVDWDAAAARWEPASTE